MSKVALITGASAGIGRATALAFAAAGYRTCISDVNEKGGKETVEMISAKHSEPSTFFKADISKEDDVIGLMKHIKDNFGQLNAAYNNAGIDGEMSKTADCTIENWNRVIGVNLTGTFLCMKYEIPFMLESGGGSIVNCSSVAGKAGQPTLGAYAASKHGVIGLTRSAAIDLATQGIRVNAVCPGVIQTAMIDHVKESGMVDIEGYLHWRQHMGRCGTPEEVAAAVLFLCSEQASLITGAALDVDGGFLAG